jgi:hypothetical protein
MYLAITVWKVPKGVDIKVKRKIKALKPAKLAGLKR